MADDTQGLKQERDTSAGCRERAAADRISALSSDTRNGRRKFEASAASWDERAAMLNRIEASFQKRAQLDAEAIRISRARRYGWNDQVDPACGRPALIEPLVG